jgi:hypothetical protein
VQVAATTAVERDYADVMRRWTEVKTRDLPALNQQLKSAGLPEIRPEVNPDSQQGGGAEE